MKILNEQSSEPEGIDREQARRDVIHGSLWFFGGIAVTGITYYMAVGGGTYFITWGAIAIGGFQLLRGLVTYHNNGGIPSGVRNTVLVAVAIAVITGFFIYQGQVGKVNVFDLKRGDCFSMGGSPQATEHTTVVVATCDSNRWNHKVLSAITISSSSSGYPQKSFFDSQAERCPSSSDFFFYPTRESWAEGDRTILCIATR